MDILALANQYRKELEPLWLKTHHEWGDPIPNPLSTHMCRYTCFYLQDKLLKDHHIQATLVIGRPDKDKNGTPEGGLGFCDKNGFWHDHAWLVVWDHILDLTADQFDAEPIIWTHYKDKRYAANSNQKNILDNCQSIKTRVSSW